MSAADACTLDEHTTEQHEAIKADRARWEQLPSLGVTDEVRGRRAELRNCTCGSTLGVWVRQ